MALFYVKATERLIHTYVIEAETAEEAEENFKEVDEARPIDTDCLEYGVESVERVPEKDEEYARDQLFIAERKED
mgnify:CR=1 FL=1